MKAIHEVLLKNQVRLAERFSTLPGAYKVQMMNALEHLCDLNAHDFIIKPRTSFIFTTEDDDTEDEENENIEKNNDSNIQNGNIDLNKNAVCESIDERDEKDLHLNENSEINTPSTRTEELLKSANPQQRFWSIFLDNILQH